jgi:hypothetical protein
MNAFTPPNRDNQHGGLESVGITSQMIKSAMRASPNWENLRLHPAGKEALDMIGHKIARVLSGGDPHDFQHWEDIAGYATAFMRTWSVLNQKEDALQRELEAAVRETMSFCSTDPDAYMASGCPDGFCPLPGVRQGPSEGMFAPICDN